MWATAVVLVLFVVSGLTYWWLGRIWPETREREQELREDKRRLREAISRRPTEPPEGTPENRPDWWPR